MKRLRLQRWSGTVLSPRTRPPVSSLSQSICKRCLAQAALQAAPADDAQHSRPPIRTGVLSEETLLKLPSPPVSAARTSAKLSALHARLLLPSSLPLETLARCLVDASADKSPRFNNASLAVLGHDLLSYYTSEYLVAQYPRLPLAVIFAAMYAYVGPRALAAITREWGVEYAAHPGGEVDPGLLQFKRMPPQPQLEQPLTAGPESIIKVRGGPDPMNKSARQGRDWRASISARTVYADEFGGQTPSSMPSTLPSESEDEGVTAERACASFVRALMAAIYLHAGRPSAKSFYRNHFMSRQLNMSTLFQFRYPTRDLNRLCAREGFQSPVARIISETGRKSRHPVFVVGVFSGNDKLGEGAGASLDEARTRAAVAALKGWYLYSPLEFRVPSEMEEQGAREWRGCMVDGGDVIT
jgi:dsRNA-specific ribonuclease